MNNNQKSIVGAVVTLLFVVLFISIFFTGSVMFTTALVPLIFILPLIINLAKRQNSGENQRYQAKMACKQCQKIIDRDSRFCKYCGTSVSEEFACEFCGEYNPKGTEYCSNCGAKLI